MWIDWSTWDTCRDICGLEGYEENHSRRTQKLFKSSATNKENFKIWRLYFIEEGDEVLIQEGTSDSDEYKIKRTL